MRKPRKVPWHPRPSQSALGNAHGCLASTKIDDTSNRVGEVVMATRTVIDAVLAETGGATLKTGQLRDQALIVEQVDGAGIDGW